MRALVYTGVQSMGMQDMPMPEPAPGEALIKVQSVGICGSDMHAYLGHDERRPAPLILGHEAAGTVVSGPMEGQRVTVNPLVTCGECPACREGRCNLCAKRQIISMPPRQGAFAEYLTMPAGNLVAVPDGFALDHAALAEPLAVCWHAVRLAVAALFGDIGSARCLVIGGGAIGFGSALALRVFGAQDVSIAETNAGRREFIGQHSDFTTKTPEEVAESDFDLVIDAVGFRGTRVFACAAVRPGGVICHIGLGDSDDGLDIRRITLQEITFFGTYTYTDQDFRDTAQAMFDGRFGDLDWVQRQDLDSGGQAFADILAGRILAPKVILHP
jgi:threonine dehydrogenase-like Zn-dependent dehydrogenase